MNIRLLSVLLITSMLISCTSAPAKIQYDGFAFIVRSDVVDVGGIYRVKWLDWIECLGEDRYICAASIRGAALRLFGQPAHISNFVGDPLYRYIIEATDEQGHLWILALSDAELGPTISGNPSDDTIEPAAVALMELLKSTSPADFEATFYNYEEKQTVTYGCKDSVCYWRAVPGQQIGK
jgi:hypothetical protein